MSSRVHQAFAEGHIPWVGYTPAGWEVKPLWAVTTCNDDLLDEAAPADQMIHYIEISDVDAIKGMIGGTDVAFGEAPSRARRLVQDGDVVVSTVRTYLRAIAAIQAPADNTVVSTGFAVMRPRAVHPAFLAYLFRSEFLISEIISRSVGVSYPAINASEIRRLRVPLPPPDDQKAIAAFLDRETAKIDALVAEQERLIAQLQEKRQTVISEAITKGLNPDVPMKPSGVEWLGEVPAHWQFMRLKQLIRPETSISYGIVQPGEPLDEGIPFVQTTNMTTGSFDREKLQKTSAEIEAAYPRSRLTGGEVILGIRASIGAAHIVPTHLAGANLSRGVARICCGDLIIASYLVTFLSSTWVAEYWALSKQGSTFNEVSIETVRDLPVPVPPLPEQNAIVGQISAHIADLDGLIAEASSASALLKERRSALISASVTGKIDVRNLVQREAAQAIAA